MKISKLAITTLLISSGIVSPSFAKVSCSFGVNTAYCWDETNALHDRYNAGSDAFKFENASNLYNDINQLYQEVLGREVDDSGFVTFSNTLEKGKSLNWVRKRLASSNEARAVITRIYQEILGRDVDQSGLKTYTTTLQRGWSLEQVRQDILDSPEARVRKQLLTIS
jgi:hypothetical protein